MIIHGGDLTAAAREFGIAESDWRDLSTGINPRPYPLPSFSDRDWQALPTASAVEEAKRAAAEFFGCPLDSVALAPGSQAVIQLMPQLLAEANDARRIAILSPTYGEAARVFTAAGYGVTAVTAATVPDGLPLWLTNPNNPDGRRVEPQQILDWGQSRPVVVDEAFAEVAPEISVAWNAGHPNLFILRSFGKFFGLAGLRLGFLLAAPAIVQRVESLLGPWAVSGLALRIAAVAYRDGDWIAATRARLRAESLILRDQLIRRGGRVLGETDLFTLIEHPRAQLVYHLLARRGILLRRFPEQPSWLRIGRNSLL
ncbi:MAG: threonine-phosphate decarboxylase CobD [Candidatus Pacebacteria bacterium]|nr:threonine-phosphate decarboxylase CobD [Candidatus Paceibacterota bacterium]